VGAAHPGSADGGDGCQPVQSAQHPAFTCSQHGLFPAS
jgi:hypothetical protein